MIESVKWEATRREKLTQGQLNDKRKEGFVPANMSTRGKDSQPLFLKEYDVWKRPYGNFRIDLQIEGEKESVMCFLKDIQYNYNGEELIHVDLQELTKGQEVDIDIVLELTGDPVGVKEGGILNYGIQSVRIRTLPRNMPEKYEVDISGLDIGDHIGIEDLTFSEEHTLLEPTEGMIASVSAPKEFSEEDLEPTDEMPEVEILSERKDEEE